MHHKDWFSSRNKPTSGPPRRVLEDRIVFCVDCDTNRSLTTNGLGQLVCSACASEAWMYLSAPFFIRYRSYSKVVGEADGAGNAFGYTCPVL